MAPARARRRAGVRDGRWERVRGDRPMLFAAVYRLPGRALGGIRRRVEHHGAAVRSGRLDSRPRRPTVRTSGCSAPRSGGRARLSTSWPGRPTVDEGSSLAPVRAFPDWEVGWRRRPPRWCGRCARRGCWPARGARLTAGSPARSTVMRPAGIEPATSRWADESRASRSTFVGDLDVPAVFGDGRVNRPSPPAQQKMRLAGIEPATLRSGGARSIP